MSKRKVKWGVLGAASIAVRKVIPGMQQGEYCDVAAIASRDVAKSRAAAASLKIGKAYGSYEELLADPGIEAIYNPLPNHLHVPWSIKAMDSGKHVLCEKPIALNAAEARSLVPVRDRAGVKIGEAFMVRTHPQWLRTRELIREGWIGELRAIVGVFSYFNRDAKNVRNKEEWGGGGLLDIGCYPITMSRFMYGAEPLRVSGVLERDPEFGTDRLASAILEFSGGQAVFTCSTQMVPYQRMQFLGTKGRIEIEIPFNAPPNKATRIFVDDGSDVGGAGIKVETIPACDQYTIQGDVFSKAILEDGQVPVSLEDAIANMAVIDAIFRGAESGKWERPAG
ncbi:MAG TPA: Gfo/Idh/MocA family oxidoreductase [Methylomirabilota bacterium]|nr:Gfo/Idh/MocA family oxidoreductase [Methylomirabilota bacterium]